jgi:hypothetical protein
LLKVASADILLVPDFRIKFSSLSLHAWGEGVCVAEGLQSLFSISLNPTYNTDQNPFISLSLNHSVWGVICFLLGIWLLRSWVRCWRGKRKVQVLCGRIKNWMLPVEGWPASSSESLF